MPFRLGLPDRKYLVYFFDSSLFGEVDSKVDDCYFSYTWHGKYAEEILERALNFAEFNNIQLVQISEIIWEYV